jgi:hypothetical protein
MAGMAKPPPRCLSFGADDLGRGGRAFVYYRAVVIDRDSIIANIANNDIIIAEAA